jgi:cell division protein FtsZ
MPNTNMSAAQNTQVSGANALDLGSVSEANQNITPDIKTNYKEIQENVKTEDPAIEDFLRDDQGLNNNNENVVFETQTLNSEKSMDQFANEENFETPQLFTGDDDIQDKEDHSHEGREDTDLSDLDFDDKDDLEIPAFLRRQTN